MYWGATSLKTSYKKLWKLLVDLNMSKADLRKATGLASGTMTKLRKGEDVSMEVLKKICSACQCGVADIIEFIPDSGRDEEELP